MSDSHQRREEPKNIGPEAMRHFNELANACPAALGMDLQKNLETDPYVEMEGERRFFVENPRFDEVRQLLATQDFNHDPFITVAEEIKSLHFNRGNQSMKAEDLVQALRKSALLKSFHSERFDAEVKIFDQVWENLVKPFLDEQAESSKTMKYFQNCHYAKIVFPDQFSNYELILRNHHFEYFDATREHLENQDWDHFFQAYKEIKFLGLDKSLPQINLSHNQWLKVKQWLAKSEAHPLYYAERLQLANMVRPLGEEELALSSEQWQSVLNTLDKYKSTPTFFEMANFVKYTPVK